MPTVAEIEATLTPQEMQIVNYHRGNMANPGVSPEGYPVTVYSMGPQVQSGPHAGKFASVPGYINGQMVGEDEALQHWQPEIDAGKWPLYNSGQELNDRSKYIHQIMEQDMTSLAKRQEMAQSIRQYLGAE